jgi:hypothetical protein
MGKKKKFVFEKEQGETYFVLEYHYETDTIHLKELSDVVDTTLLNSAIKRVEETILKEKEGKK